MIEIRYRAIVGGPPHEAGGRLLVAVRGRGGLRGGGVRSAEQARREQVRRDPARSVQGALRVRARREGLSLDATTSPSTLPPPPSTLPPTPPTLP
ncbi:unnamed protein product, partial [Iphiclides podalirius]